MYRELYELPPALTAFLRLISRRRRFATWTVEDTCAKTTTNKTLSVMDLALYMAYVDQLNPQPAPLRQLMRAFDVLSCLHLDTANRISVDSVYQRKRGDVSEMLGEALCLITLFRDFGVKMVADAEPFLTRAFRTHDLAVARRRASRMCPDFLALHPSGDLMIVEAKGSSSGSAMAAGTSHGTRQVQLLQPVNRALHPAYGRLVVSSLISIAPSHAPLVTELSDPPAEGDVPIDVTDAELARYAVSGALRLMGMVIDAEAVVTSGIPTERAQYLFREGVFDRGYVRLAAVSRRASLVCTPLFAKAMTAKLPVEEIVLAPTVNETDARDSGVTDTYFYSSNEKRSILPIGLGVSLEHRTH